MKILIDFLQNKTVTVNGVEKEIKEVSYTDESGQVQATIWRFDKENVEFPGWAEIAPGSTIEATPWVHPTSGKITLYAPKIERTKASTFSSKPKVDVAGHLEVQKEITKNVEAASDRNMWMWAKYGATELVASHAAFKFLTEEEIAKKIEDLATSIYLMEPTRPF